MAQAKLPAVLMIVGFLSLASGGILAPPGVYRAAELADRLKIISEHQTRWSASSALGAFGVLTTAAAFVLFGSLLWRHQNGPLLALGMLAYAVSGVAIALQSYRRATDPAVQLAATASLDQVGFYALLLGIFIFGFVFLQAGYPDWFGYLSIGSAVLLGIGAAFSNLAIAEVAYIVPLIAAIVIWRSA